MIEPRGRSGGLRPLHGVALVVGFVAAAVVTWIVFTFVVGILFKIVEIVIVAAIIAAAVHLLSRRSRRRRI